MSHPGKRLPNTINEQRNFDLTRLDVTVVGEEPKFAVRHTVSPPTHTPELLISGSRTELPWMLIDGEGNVDIDLMLCAKNCVAICGVGQPREYSNTCSLQCALSFYNVFLVGR